AVLGLVIGANVVTKPTALALLPLPLLIPIVDPGREWRQGLRAAARALAPAALGLAIPFVPVVVRNVVVGAAPLSLETRGPEAFVAGNAEGSTGVHWFPPATTEKVLYGHARRILRETHDRFLPTVVETLKTHAADPMGYVRLLGRKVAAVVNDYEPPN